MNTTTKKMKKKSMKKICICTSNSLSNSSNNNSSRTRKKRNLGIKIRPSKLTVSYSRSINKDNRKKMKKVMRAKSMMKKLT